MRLGLSGCLCAVMLALVGVESASAQCCPAPYVHAEFLHMRASRTPSPYASNDVTQNNFELDLQDTQFDWDQGFSLGVGYLLTNCMDVDFTYTHFVNDGRSQIGDPNLNADLVIPLQGNFGMADVGTEDLTLSYQTFDLTVGRYFEAADGLTLRVLGGLRGAQTFYASDVLFTDNQFARPFVQRFDLHHREINMDGLGLRLGGEAHWSLWDTGLSLVGRATGSLIWGDFNVIFVQSDENGPLAQVRMQYEQIVPVLDLRVGTRFDYGPVYIYAGYQMATWFDYLTTIDGLANAVPAINTGNLALDGFFVEAGFIW